MMEPGRSCCTNTCTSSDYCRWTLLLVIASVLSLSTCSESSSFIVSPTRPRQQRRRYCSACCSGRTVSGLPFFVVDEECRSNGADADAAKIRLWASSSSSSSSTESSAQDMPESSNGENNEDTARRINATVTTTTSTPRRTSSTSTTSGNDDNRRSTSTTTVAAAGTTAATTTKAADRGHNDDRKREARAAGVAERETAAKDDVIVPSLEFALHASIDDIPAESWNACLRASSSASVAGGVGGGGGCCPFLEHSFLRALEESECASPKTGWIPQHVSIRLASAAAASQQQVAAEAGSPTQQPQREEGGEEGEEGEGEERQQRQVLQGGGSEVCGYVPLYVKGHSWGEFIFDHSWAEAAYRSGIEYYPKLLVGVPFTPAAGGPRILWSDRIHREYFCRNGQTRKLLNRRVGEFVKQLTQWNRISSAHWNFITDEEAEALSGTSLPEPQTTTSSDGEDDDDDVNSFLFSKNSSPLRSLFERFASGQTNGYMRRTSLQYHWNNRNPKRNGEPYDSFDEYLNCRFKSKRRINIRRERRQVKVDSKARIDAVRGKEILRYPGLVERMFEIYLSTIRKMSVWGRQYLTLEFFQLLVKTDFVDHLLFLCARPNNNDDGASSSSTTSEDVFRAEDVFAGTINVVKDGVFYGRYWGCLPGRAVKNLHFETCYWSAIEYCIEHKLDRMEPGAGGADYKWTRGFDPVLIHSVHYISHPGLRRAVGDFLYHETEDNVELTEYLLGRTSSTSSTSSSSSSAVVGSSGSSSGSKTTAVAK